MINIPRKARKDLNTPFLHVMVQGVNKEYIFYKKEYIEKYLEIIKKNKQKYNFTIIAYCIMNNHAHFLVYTEDINSFGKFMQKTNLLYAQMYNREEKRCGVLFRNRYQVEPIYNIKHLVNCIKYIHDNPVKAKMVLKCEDYMYSSYKDFINNTGVTQSKIMINMFGRNCKYKELFNKVYDRKFMDLETYDEQNYIISGIKEFQKEQKINMIEILSNREIFKKLIVFLKDECGLQYKEIRIYFDISKGAMDTLKINKNINNMLPEGVPKNLYVKFM